MAATTARSLIELEVSTGPPSALVDRVYATLKQQILTCKLAPGHRLVEKELCAEMGISRTPLREALNRLGLEGLVTLVPYRGYEVIQITVEDIRNLSELRRIVEAESAALAAERATPEDCAQLLKLAELRYVPGNRKTYKSYLRANCAFHLALVRCTRNPRLETIVISVLDQIQRPLYFGLDVGIDSQSATAEHLQVVEAVRARDPIRARQLMGEQISGAESRMIAAMKALPEFAADREQTKQVARKEGRAS
jgi:DNA-binding GntR family transcriptional regulator